MIRITKAVTSGHLRIVQELQQAIFIADDHERLTDTTWFIARDSSFPVGFAGCRVVKDYMYLCLCGVLPSHRGLGLQKRFLKIREKHARLLDLTQSITYTLLTNHVSSNNLITAGYSLYQPEFKYRGDYVLYWYKEL